MIQYTADFRQSESWQQWRGKHWIDLTEAQYHTVSPLNGKIEPANRHRTAYDIKIIELIAEKILFLFLTRAC